MTDNITIDILGKRTVAFSIILTMFWLSAATTLAARLVLDYGAIVYCSFILSFALAMVLAVLKNRKVIGTLMLDADAITHQSVKTHELGNIEHLKLVCRDFDGAAPNAFARSVFVAKGSDNKLMLVDNGTTYHYRLLLRENQVIPLNNIVRQWQEKGVSLQIGE